MAEEIVVDAVVKEKTYVGRIAIPVSVPEGLVQHINFPEDVFHYARKMGVDDEAVKFLMAILHGKWALSAILDLQEVAINTGLQYPAMDGYVRDWIKKGYARLNGRLNLYRFWIALLHVKGIRFVAG